MRAGTPRTFSVADNFRPSQNSWLIQVQVFAYYDWGTAAPENQFANIDRAYVRIWRNTPDSRGSKIESASRLKNEPKVDKMAAQGEDEMTLHVSLFQHCNRVHLFKKPSQIQAFQVQ